MNELFVPSINPVRITGKSRAFLIGVAVVTLIAFLGLTQLMPLRGVSNTVFLLRLVVEILASLALLYALVRLAGEPPAALGLQRFKLSTVGWAFACFVATLILGGAAAFLASKAGITQNKDVLALLSARPIWVLLLIAAAAGIAEETVFRSIMISHIESATGSTAVASIVSIAAFALAHFNGWGASQILLATAPGIVLTLFFVWRRNLLICIISHFLTDALGLIVAASMIGRHP
jgi:membrane protease YdiL (CAAX protease family)